jgi:hypothetical protein
VPDTHPFIVLLDDDDIFMGSEALQIIKVALYILNEKAKVEHLEQFVNNAKYRLKAKETVVQWKMKRLDHCIPDRMNVKTPILGNCTGGGICFHRDIWKDWDNKSGADYRFIKYLWENTLFFGIDEILTAMQTGPGMGQRKDLPNE